MISGSCLQSLRNGDCLARDGILDGDGNPTPQHTTPAGDLLGLLELLALELIRKDLAVLSAGGLLNGDDERALTPNPLFAARLTETFPCRRKRSFRNIATSI